MGLKKAFAEFDGKHADPLRSAAAEFDESDAAELAAECHGEYAVAATWVVKALLGEDRATSLDMNRVFAALRNKNHWETILHLLQSVQHAPEPALAHVFTIRGLLDHQKTLVRVWALDAFVRVAQVDGNFLPEARRLVDSALNTGAASKRARAKALRRVLDQTSP